MGLEKAKNVYRFIHQKKRNRIQYYVIFNLSFASTIIIIFYIFIYLFTCSFMFRLQNFQKNTSVFTLYPVVRLYWKLWGDYIFSAKYFLFLQFIFHIIMYRIHFLIELLFKKFYTNMSIMKWYGEFCSVYFLLLSKKKFR